jgi:hypothetical protein
VTLRRPFQQSAMRSVTLTLTFRSLSILESQSFKHGGVRQSYRAKAIADCHIPKFVEIPVSHHTETEKCRKVNLIRQGHLKNL